MVACELAGDLDAIHARQADVHEDHVRVKLVDQRQSNLARAGVTHYLQVGVGVKNLAGAIAVQGMVVNHDDADPPRPPWSARLRVHAAGNWRRSPIGRT
jgi:hypothetical protein